MAFRLATWNVLATAYIRPAYYPTTPAQFLDAAWRVPALARHAASMAMDILCLQEVERATFSALKKTLDTAGYQGTHAIKGRGRPDGCAVFFRVDRFRLLGERRILYDDGAGGANSGHIAQVVDLDQDGRRLRILNTHLKWDPPRTPRERQWGYRQVLQAIAALQEDPAAAQIPCGDLNVTPETGVIEALLAAGLDYAHRGQRHLFTCNSNAEPKMIDYLFFNSRLRANPLSPIAIDARTVLPSPECPSDHVPLAAEFDWVR